MKKAKRNPAKRNPASQRGPVVAVGYGTGNRVVLGTADEMAVAENMIRGAGFITCGPPTWTGQGWEQEVR